MPTQKNEINRRQLLSSIAACAAPPIIINSFLGKAMAKAPMLGSNKPKHTRFKLGAFELTNISDSESYIDGPYPIIGKNSTEQKVIALMKQNLLPEKTYQPGFTPTLLNTGEQLILFDTGNGDNGFIPKPKGGWLEEQLKPAGYSPDQIDIVVISHGHPDHVGGLVKNGKAIYKNARYIIGQKEYDYWSPKGKHSGEMEKLAKVFQNNTKNIADKFSFIKPGDDIVHGVQAIEAYGHTPGQLAMHIESQGQQILLWADCAHHHVASLARPDWHCVFDINKESAVNTRKKIFDMVATDKMAAIGYHMPFPSIGYVEKLKGSGYRWLQHSFQLK